MSDQSYQQPADRQFNASDTRQTIPNPFLEYQMPGFRAYNANPAPEYAPHPPAPYYDPNYRPPQPPNLIGQDGWPVQGTGTNFRQALSVIDPERLAEQQANGRLSREMIYACNQIWDNTRNPQAVNQLLQDVDTDLQRLGSPYQFGSTFEPVPPGSPPGTLPRMAIIFEDLRVPEHTNRISLH